MKRTKFLLGSLLALVVSMPVQAATVLQFDFEDLEALAGSQSNTGTASAVISANLTGDTTLDMYGWASSSANNSPYVSAVGDTASGEGVCLEFPGSQDGYIPAGNLAWAPTAWTVECSVYFTSLSGWQTFIGDGGSSAGTSEADFYLTNNGIDNSFRINIYTAGGTRWILDGDYDPVIETWYHIAVVSDGVTLEMFLDDGSGAGFQSIGTVDMSAQTVAENALPGGGYTWSFGRGWYNGNTDYMAGSIDDIRFSDAALDPSEFLQAEGVVVGNPTPKSKSTLVDIDTDLDWDFTATEGTLDHYAVYISSDPNDYAPEATTENPDPNAFDGFTPYTVTDSALDISATISEYANGLAYEKLYKWRVDTYLVGATAPVVGPLWSFTTTPDAVTIITQPKADLANPTAELTVVASSAAAYKWYKVGVEEALSESSVYSGVTSSTLTITTEDVSDEGYYYCKAMNGPTEAESTSVISTNSVYVWTDREIAHYTFDADFSDEVSGLDGVLADADPDDSLGLAVGNGIEFAEGMIGNAAVFEGDSDYIQINDEGLLNFYGLGGTISFWVKYTGEAAPAWRLLMCKFDIGSNGWLFGLDSAGVVMINEGGAAAYDNDDTTAYDGEWHLVTCVVDAEAGTATMYLDGYAGAVGNVNFAAQAKPVSPTCIGGEGINGGLSIDGMIDEVRMYSYPMTQHEIIDQLYYPYSQTAVCIESYASEYDFTGPDGAADCTVNVYDFAEFAATWLSCGRYPVDTCSN